MSEKRALIVDDSKSARVVLSRMLEKHELAVDTSDSAEQALEYLKAHRPDVIFMDHLMPGMDGLQAVRAIRSNPETAAIPIMMYTSQEGELYLGQARALGATGVLPKRIGSTEVSRILQDLRLLPDAAEGIAVGGGRDGVAAAAEPATGDAASAVAAPTAPTAPAAPDAAAAPPATPGAPAATVPHGPPPPAGATLAEVRELVEPLLRQHSSELRRFVVASLDSFAARVVAETRESVRTVPPPTVAPEPLPAPVVPAAPVAPAVLPATTASRPTGWIALAAVATLAAVAAGAFAAWQQRQIESLATRVAELSRTAPAATPSAAATTGTAAVDATPTPGAARSAPVAAGAPPALVTVAVPYGEPALAGERVERLAALLADLERRGFRGTVAVTAHAGDFCLTGNAADGWALAPGEMPANRCDVVGNPAEDARRPAERRSAEYDALVAAVRARTGGAIQVRGVEAGRAAVAVPYPTAPDASAAQWNAAAAANQRVEFRAEPARP